MLYVFSKPSRRFLVLALLPVFLLVGQLAGAATVNSRISGESLIAGNSDDPAAYLAYADFMMGHRAYKEAADILEKGRTRANPSAELLVRLGEAYEGLELFARAEAVTREALQLDPEHVPAHVRMGELYFRLGWNKSGLDSFREAVALDPEADLPKIRLVGGLCEDNQLETAENQCLEFIASNAQSPELWLSLGQVFEKQEKRRQAFTTYGQVLTIDPKNSQAYARQGRLFCEFGQFHSAESACRRAIELDPENPIGHAYLGIACAKLGQNDEARIHAEIAEDAGLNMVSVWKIIEN